MIETATVLVSLADVQRARERIGDAVRTTPLIPAPLPRAGGRAATDTPDAIWLKCENLQRVSAFKARGAYHFVSRLTPEERERGLLTYSSGNHAQAVAFAAREFGVPARVVMPVDAPAIKREATIALGAVVDLEGTTSDERRTRAEQIQREEGGVMVPPFDHPDIIAGQGTLALELVEQLGAKGPGLVMAPIGGGGQLSGVAAAVKGLCPDAQVVGVEPEGAASMLRSLESGAPVTLDRVSTVADGLMPVRPGDLTFAHCRDLVDRVVTVDDESIREAVRWLFGLGLVVEPSGAVTVAALLSAAVQPADQGETVAILSGGNIELAHLADWLSG